MALKVYAIRNRTTEEVYYGSTTKQYLSQRWAVHTYDYRQYQAGTHKWVSSFKVMECPTAYIELVEECDEGVRRERERWWIANDPHSVNTHYKPKTEEEKDAKRRYDTERMRVWRAKQKRATG